MFINKSDLLSQINSIIQKTSLKDKQWNLDFSLIQRSSGSDPTAASNNHDQTMTVGEIKKLEERVEKLEQHNEQMLSIVHLLSERFRELVGYLLESSRSQDLTSSYKSANSVSVSCTPGKSTCEKNKPILTKREMDVFNLLAKGFCAKEIAKTLFISETTVITHKRNLKEKFSAKNTVELVSKAFNAIGNSK